VVESERVGSPLDTNIKYNLDLRELNDKEKSEYLELFGSTQCISNKSRSDIAYAANFLGRHRQKPTCQHAPGLSGVGGGASDFLGKSWGILEPVAKFWESSAGNSGKMWDFCITGRHRSRVHQSCPKNGVM
jgi:hypothetical protein